MQGRKEIRRLFCTAGFDVSEDAGAGSSFRTLPLHPRFVRHCPGSRARTRPGCQCVACWSRYDCLLDVMRFVCCVGVRSHKDQADRLTVFSLFVTPIFLSVSRGKSTKSPKATHSSRNNTFAGCLTSKPCGTKVSIQAFNSQSAYER